MRVDLHLHTWVSDGDVSPAELVRLAAGAHLDVIAVTDHDTAAGVAAARAAAAGTGVAVVPGIEISSRWDGREHHILGYWIDEDSASIREHQRRAATRRYERMEAMVARLQAMGLHVTLADVEAAAGPEVRTLGRPHLARALHARGLTRFYGEAFLRYIGDGGPAFVAENFPTPAEAIEAIHAAGGVAAWAHPALDYVDVGLPLMASWGLDGVECFRPAVEPEVSRALERTARDRGLFPTGGSDWHGPRRCPLGEFAVAHDRVPEVLAAAPQQEGCG